LHIRFWDDRKYGITAFYIRGYVCGSRDRTLFPTRDETYNSHEIKGITYDVKDGGAPVLPAPETDSQKGGYETG